MITFGIMQTSLQHEKKYMLNLARAGNKCGFTVYRFRPGDVLEPILHGLQYDGLTDRWKKASFPIPDYIYDRCFHSSPTEQTIEFIKQLKNLPHATFLGYGLPGKWKVYKKLKKDHILKWHLPLTFKLNIDTGPQTVSDLLSNRSEIILKPINGSQGNDLVYITKHKNGFHLQINHKGDVLHHNYDTTTSFYHFIYSLLSQQEYMAQEMLNLRDKHNKPFDRRVVMKKQAAIWKEVGRANRVGMAHSFVSNLHSGGVIKRNEDLGISNEILLQSNEIISQLSSRAALLIEQHFPPKFELGLDFGIDQTGHVWLLEANSKPGHNIIQNKDDLHFLPFQYCRHLQSQKKGVNKI